MQIINIMQNLKGKTALVTGGGRGLGKAVALALAAAAFSAASADRLFDSSSSRLISASVLKNS